ncbi:hypothetical protein WJX84_000537 [Apatococcus fuscideae]
MQVQAWNLHSLRLAAVPIYFNRTMDMCNKFCESVMDQRHMPWAAPDSWNAWPVQFSAAAWDSGYVAPLQ